MVGDAEISDVTVYVYEVGTAEVVAVSILLRVHHSLCRHEEDIHTIVYRAIGYIRCRGNLLLDVESDLGVGSEPCASLDGVGMV